jgi:hypothetical protein
MYSAEGAGGQRIDVLPGANLVYVHLADTYNGEYVNNTKSLQLLEMILNAKNSRSKTDPKLVPLISKPKFTNLIKLDPAAIEKYIGNYKFNSGVRMRVSKEGAGLTFGNSPLERGPPPRSLKVWRRRGVSPENLH